MSGGVDSSVAAALLKEAGHDVVGVTMKTFCYSGTPGHARTCCGLDGIADARRVAVALDIPHYVFDVEEEFTRDVIDDFVAEYAQGRTPNPCVRCNGTTKFRDLLERGRALECDAIASGHYVRWTPGPGEPRLLRGADRRKDQSYFLWELPRAMLPSLRFPLGDLTKTEVRERARSLALATADKPESQEICFVPTGDYRDLLRRRLGLVHPALQPGTLVDRSGTVLGEHDGYAGFTVGQRKGLGGGFGEAMFVLEIRPGTREVVVGTRQELLACHVEVSELNWLAEAPVPGARLRVQLRYRARDVPSVVRETGSRLTLELMEEVAAVTPGQSAVFYDGDRVLGGGRVARAAAR
ncbi:MAG: tRNA 2-thiouridine(34) synthase MnmA [Gemmatimonadetes bacterium]|nr:tRNA 2-thiouridine(34) synthase MnmA [Gemmatimonadota bacterium]